MEIGLQNYSSWLRVDHEWTTADTTAVCLLFAGAVLFAVGYKIATYVDKRNEELERLKNVGLPTLETKTDSRLGIVGMALVMAGVVVAACSLLPRPRFFSPEYKPYTLAEYLDSTYIDTTIGDFKCPTVPLQHNGGWAVEELNRQYTCEWKDSGKEKEGRLVLKNGRYGYTATLLDGKGNRYCPTGWKSEDGCLPVVMPK